MRQQGLAGRRRRRFQRTTDSNHRFSVAANVLMRDFHVKVPNLVWVTDITYVSKALLTG
jgi:transposase InsO family protein